ncbi:SusC/RagA family TonB-linked outer membrane protein [Chryseobacterium indologenes]|uniref:SusC/RagA family TonB-linked outer membrane protein n=1 Tax=Chryseobacterium indologenes TaxID=253 RepID=UPI000F51387D|nr:SusC/RagA family TonB-linked outer membrane protein [Chryseobacterium indologenes]AYZ34363.1 SusC/RagA family TonB-linked outer membrane protein [Chryseobacterium indologenes]MBF6642907.1 SusC/RagA family TonB-linked outer membrane protein [Chryseobacterium indologenes]MBU3048215.1 SusC/RagA family TonB-linked outer membrane protein [Chryseobacterium indologenes]MEB4763246.1 SusC/RagA family TonB-linked outer membrane protein [Chryseobacterium indologenes]QQQ73206.1 SusC/RagA family TonB-li
MKKLTTSLLVLMLTSSVAIANAQEKKNDTVKTKEIEGVVVTALGIKREKRSLGYATQEVKGDAVNKNPTTNFLNNLSGKVAGLEIKQSTNFGGSVNVVMRGFKSLLGDNQALFVVDGIPILNNNINTTSQNTGGGGYDYGSAISDINPNDIETVNVLKGAAATALYGSRAQNGVILITTKKGKRNKEGIGLEFSSSITMSTVDRSTFPKYQTQYGQGYRGRSFAGTLDGSPIVEFGNDASYGSPYDGSLVWQYGAFTPGSPTEGQRTPWQMAKNGPIKFFDVGATYVNNIALSGGDEKATYRLSYSNTNASDIMPNSELMKNNFSGSASYKLTDKLTANFYANYVTQKTKGRNSTGYNDNIMTNFRQWWATNVDIKDLQYLYRTYKKNYTWNINATDDLSPGFWDNPYFQRYENYQNDSRDRFAGNFSLNYDVSKDFNLLFRMGTDGYTMMTEERKAVGSYVGNLFGLNTVVQPSGYALSNYKFNETNYDLIATYKKNITEDFNVTALLGGNVNVQKAFSNQQSTSGGLYTPGIYTISNSKSNPVRPLISDISKYVYGVFAQVSLGYANTYYLEGTIRRDQSTALPDTNAVYWYPSVSGSIVFSNLVKANWLNFGKVRAGYSQVGSDTRADQLLNRYFAQASYGDVPVYAYNATLRNFDLKSQGLKNIEVGIETKLFNNRFGFDISWFQNKAYDQILALPVSYGTGASAKTQNAGELTTKGFEVAVNVTPIKTTNFSWDLNLNWSNPWTKVTALSPGIENISIGRLQGGASVNAPLNGDYGTIWTSDFVYDSNGQKIVGPNGAYLVTDKAVYDQGSFQARWSAGLNNTINYKNLSLSFLIDWRQGGKVYSLDQSYGYGTGLYPDSVGLNDLGNPIRNSVYNTPGNPNSGYVSTPLGGVIQPGVMADPNNPGHYIPNTIRLDKSVSSQNLQTDLPGAAYIYDASFVKLREVAITYRFNKNIFNSKFIQGMSMSLIGNNLWIIHKNLPYSDPEAGLSAGNIQGYQSGPLPTTRNISFNVKINF